MTDFEISKLRFGTDGLVPVVAQDERSGDVLMVAFADREALEATTRSGLMHYHSRSRGRLWKKGETSGNEQTVRSLHADCDGDAVLAVVRQQGPACHTGADTCFDGSGAILPSLDRLIESRKASAPASSYTARLLDDPNLCRKKIGEESAELVAALAVGNAAEIAAEAADLVYHVLVAARSRGVSWSDVAAELGRRRSPSTPPGVGQNAPDSSPPSPNP